VNELGLQEAYEKWAGDLVGVATAMVGPDRAADVVADAFASLLRRPAGWVEARDPRAFLYRAVVNTARMEHRSTARRRTREHAALRLTPAAPDSPLADPDIARVVATLTPQQRAIVHLVYWEDRSLPATAAALGISVGSVKQQLDRARNRLRKVIS